MSLTELLPFRILSHPTVLRHARETGVDFVLSDAGRPTKFLHTSFGPSAHSPTLPSFSFVFSPVSPYKISKVRLVRLA